MPELSVVRTFWVSWFSTVDGNHHQVQTTTEGVAPLVERLLTLDKAVWVFVEEVK